MNRQRAERVRGLGVVAGACVLALAASLFMLFGLSVATETGVATSDGDSSVVRGSEDAVQGGVASLVFFGVPVVVAAVPLLAMRRRNVALGLRVASTGLLFLWVLFLAFGGGIFYMPATAAMAVAAALAAAPDQQAAGLTHRATPTRQEPPPG